MSEQVFDYDMTLRTYFAAANRPNISSQYAKLYGPEPLSEGDHTANLVRFIAIHGDKAEMTFQVSPEVVDGVDVPALAARTGTTIEARTETKAGVRGEETRSFLRVRYGAITADSTAAHPGVAGPPVAFTDLGRALGGLAATAGKAIEAAAADVSDRIDESNVETELRGVAKEVERGVTEAGAYVGAQIGAVSGLTAPPVEAPAPIARPPRAGPDPRVPIALRAAGLTFAEREAGGFEVVRNVDEYRITVNVASCTSVAGRLEVRAVWSEAPRKPAPLSVDLADRILQLGAASPLGAWVVRAEPNGSRQAAFVARVPAALDSESLSAVIEHVADEVAKVR